MKIDVTEHHYDRPHILNTETGKVELGQPFGVEHFLKQLPNGPDENRQATRPQP